MTAVVVPREDADVSADDVLAHCRTQLAGYKIPKYVVMAPSLPKNPSGKVLKRDLRERHAELARNRKRTA